MRRAIVVVVLLGIGLCTQAALADVRVSSVYGSNMVLQRGVPIRVAGKADPGEQVLVTLGDDSRPAITNGNGDWSVLLSKRDAGGPLTMTIQGKNTLTFDNVLIGEVWACSGQSNMQFPVNAVVNVDQEKAAANYPNIRLLTVPTVTAQEPQFTFNGQWTVCSPDTVGGFTAVGYFFGRDLHKELGIPIGLINTSWGGTPAESWTSRAVLEADPKLRYMVTNWDKIIADYPAAIKQYNEVTLPEWQKKVEEAKAKGEQPPQQPGTPAGPGNPWQPASLFNAMIAPLTPCRIAGAIWYQGESNAGRAYEYRTLFPAMIECWRDAFDEGDFPFLFVQLANFMARQDAPGESAWAELREAQLRTLKLDDTGMAVIIDIGDAADIHPRNKQDVGKRLALWALARTYHKHIPYFGPECDDADRAGNKMVLHFDHADGGLVAKGDVLHGFAIAGRDRKLVWALAKIVGNDRIEVWNPGVPHPVAVRYGWADNPDCTLYNGAGLAATPFRTDDWPGTTWPKE